MHRAISSTATPAIALTAMGSIPRAAMAIAPKITKRAVADFSVFGKSVVESKTRNSTDCLSSVTDFRSPCISRMSPTANSMSFMSAPFCQISFPARCRARTVI